MPETLIPFLIQPDYRIRMLQSGPSIIFRPGIWYLQLAFSAIWRTWCEPYGLKDPFDQEFIQTTDSINCLLLFWIFRHLLVANHAHNAVQQTHLLCPSACCSLCKPAAHRGHPS